MAFSDPKYPNPIRTQKLRVFYRYFNHRPEMIRIREEPNRTQTKNLQVPIVSKCLGPERNLPEPGPKIRRPNTQA